MNLKGKLPEERDQWDGREMKTYLWEDQSLGIYICIYIDI
jgi:hypothetical protein